MSAPTAHLLAGLLLDVGLKSTPFLLVGLGADRALRRAPAATRHAVWATVFAALPVLAVAAWSARGQDLAVEATWIASI